MILELLASPLARRILGALLTVAALAAIVFAIYHAGAHAGAAEEASRQIAAAKSSFDRIEADARARLDAAGAREQQLTSLVEKLTSDSAAASARAAAAQSAASTDRARIAALSDAALRSELAQRLGLAPLGNPSGAGKSGGSGNSSTNDSVILSKAIEDSGPAGQDQRHDPNLTQTGRSAEETQSANTFILNSPSALRAIDARLSDCEHLSEQTAALAQQVTALTARDAARDAQLTATASERDAALDAYNQLVPLYAQAFRAATRRHRRWFCLFVCSTGPRLTLPPPLALPAPPRGNRSLPAHESPP